MKLTKTEEGVAQMAPLEPAPVVDTNVGAELPTVLDNGAVEGYNIHEQTMDEQPMYDASQQPSPDIDELAVRRALAYKKKKPVRFPFQHKNFPSESEPQGANHDIYSDAHRYAIWWASQPDVVAGDQALAWFAGHWYLIQKFDDADNGYQVEERITKKEYDKIAKEIKENGRSGRIKSVQGGTDWIDSLARQSGVTDGAESGASRADTGYRGENNQILTLGEKSLDGRERGAGDRDGDHESGGADRQGDPVRHALPEDGAAVNDDGQTPVQRMAQRARVKQETAEIDAYAREHVEDYRKLSAPKQQSVRATIRQAKAYGLSDAEVQLYARVSARSGLSIVFDASGLVGGDGMLVGNTIYVDPNTPAERRRSRILLHEAAHAMLREKNGQNLVVQAFRHIDPERSQEVSEQYIKFYREKGLSIEQYMPIVNEEITTAYIEDVLGDIDAWDYILSEKPTLKEGWLNFFRKSAQAYAADQQLSSEARKLLRTYKKLFDRMSERNRGVSMDETSYDGGVRYAKAEDEPIYEPYRGLAVEVPSDIREGEDRGVEQARYKYHISDSEDIGLSMYVSGAAYEINALQRQGRGAEWSEYDTWLAESIEAALKKHPAYEGRVYRNLNFDSVFSLPDAYENFLAENQEGRVVTLHAFTSASKDPNGYPVGGGKTVHLVIDSISAADISQSYGLSQKEVVLLPGTAYMVTRVTAANDGAVLIYGKEMAQHEVQELSRGAQSQGQKRASGVFEGARDDDVGVSHDRRVLGSEAEGGGGTVHKTVSVQRDDVKGRSELTKDLDVRYALSENGSKMAQEGRGNRIETQKWLCCNGDLLHETHTFGGVEFNSVPDHATQKEKPTDVGFSFCSPLVTRSPPNPNNGMYGNCWILGCRWRLFYIHRGRPKQ